MRVPHLLASADGSIPAASERHLRTVLRLRPGAPLSLTDGAGRVADAVLGADVVERTSEWTGAQEAHPVLVLHPGVSKAAKLDLVVEKATELGVAAVVPVITARSERRWDDVAARKRVQRWQGIARSALEQSRGAWLPDVRPPVSFGAMLELGAGTLLDPSGAAVRFDGVPAASRIAVGPEGGFEPDELIAALDAGWDVATLGGRVLRTETAAIVAAGLHAQTGTNRRFAE